MTLSPITVGALIRKQIQIENRKEPTDPHSIPIKETIPKKKELLFKDENGVQFELGSIYFGEKVHEVVRCKILKKELGNIYRNKYIYPVNRGKRIIKPGGTVSGLEWQMFRNVYKFLLVTVPEEKFNEVQIEAKFFTYNKNETKRRDQAGDKAAIGFHKGVIKESIEHCRYKRNMSVIEDPNIIENLKKSNFWTELGYPINPNYRFDNVTMASTIWKYRGKWIISSHSAYLKIMDGDK